MEIAVEVRDNEVLRELKASKKTRLEGVFTDGLNCKSDSLVNNYVTKEQDKQSFVPGLNLEQLRSLQDDLLCPTKVQNCKLADCVDMDYTQDGPKETDACYLTNVDVSKSFTVVQDLPNTTSKCQITEDVTDLTLKMSNATSDVKQETSVRQDSKPDVPLSSRTSVVNITKTFAVDIDDDVTLLGDDVTQVKPTLNIRKEYPTSLPLSNPGIC